MKLGLSQATYRWVCYPWLRYDTPEYRLSERRLPYFASTRPPETLDKPIDWLIDRVLAHGLESLYMESGWFGDEAAAAAFKARMAEHGLAYFGSVGVNLAATEEEWGSPRYNARSRAQRRVRYRMTVQNPGWAGGSEFGIATRAMELAAAAGARVIVVVHGVPTLHNHFTKDPPLAEQIDRIIRNTKTLVPVAESLGLVMAHEAHMDYRVADYVQVLEGVGSPWLRHNFDFANSISVIEDPLDAARMVARYTVMTHIKDMRVQPTTLIGEPVFHHTPIGLGDVPVGRILEVLQAEAPEPDSLHHCVEVNGLAEYDAEQWLVASLEWLRTTCARFWT